MIRFFGLILLIGCRSVPAASERDCVPSKSGQVGAIPLDALMGLPGVYAFTAIATSPGMDRSSVASELTLVPADTLQRYYERRLRGYVRSGNRPVVGALNHRSSEGQFFADNVVVQQNPSDTQLISGYCELCNDASIVYYTILHVGRDRFSGRWVDPQTGIGIIVDRNGQPISNPAGYFCAVRIK